MAISLDSITNLSPELQRAFQGAVQAERKQVQTLVDKKTAVEGRVKLLDDVLGKVHGVRTLLPDMANPVALRELAFGTADNRIITGTVDKSIAEPGKYDVEVMQLASHATGLSNTFADKDKTRIGTGYLTFTTAAGESKEIYIDNDNATLEGVAHVINNSRLGMKASIVNDQSNPDEPFRLLLSAEGAGAGKDVEYPEFYFIDGESDFYIDTKKAAQNAKVKFEGMEIESPSNEIKDMIQGVSLNLKGTTEPGRPLGVSVETDLPKMRDKVKGLVDNVNGVLGFIQSQNKIDEHTDTSKTLGGDYGIRMAEGRIREALQENFLNLEGDVRIRSLGDMGIQFNRNGTLNLDEKKLEHALGESFDEVANLLSGDGVTNGIVPRLNRALISISEGDGGLLSSQKKNYTDRSARMQKEIDTKEKASEKRMESLRDKLVKTQSAIGSIQNQGNYFSGQGMDPASMIGLPHK